MVDLRFPRRTGTDRPSGGRPTPSRWSASRNGAGWIWALPIVLLFTGCVTSDMTTAEGCSSDTECGEGFACRSGECVDTSGERPGGRPERDSGTPPVVDAGDGDAVSEPDNPTLDIGGSDTQADTGAPDDADDDGPTDADDADDGFGVVSLAPCEAALTECAVADGAPRDDGDFWCYPVGEAAVCLEKCGFPGETGECSGEDQVCWGLASTAGSLRGCIPSQCDDYLDPAEDCPASTCMMVVEGIGLCFGAGEVAAGEVCDLDAGDRADFCTSGTFCAPSPSSDTVGVCRPLCDAWSDGTGECAGAQACVPWIGLQGICQPSTTQSPLEPCETEGAWCGPRTECIRVNTGPDTEDNLCVGWCRRGHPEDCAFDPGLVCNWRVFRNRTEMGLCVSPCDPEIGCGLPGWDCREQICREPCVSDTDCREEGWGCLNNACVFRPPGGS